MMDEVNSRSTSSETYRPGSHEELGTTHPRLSVRLWWAVVRRGLALAQMLRQIAVMFKSTVPDDDLSYMPKRDKIVEGVLLMLQQAKTEGIVLTTDTLFAAMFIADKEHLDTSGRPVFFENYVGTDGGPIGLAASEMLAPGFDWSTVSEDEAPWTMEADQDGVTILTRAKRDPNLRLISRSDVRVLSSVLTLVASLNAERMKHFTHRNPAYIAAIGKGVGERLDPRLIAEERDDELIDDLLYASRYPL